MKQQNQQLLERIVNSKAKQQGNFTRTCDLVCEELLTYLTADGITVWLFDEVFDAPLSPVLNSDADHLLVNQNSTFKRLISHRGILQSLADSLPQESQTQLPFDYFNGLRDNRYLITDFPCEHPLTINSQQYYQVNQITCVIDVAIRINGVIEGVLSIDYHQASMWQNQHLEVIIQCADQLALALATRYSYDKSERIKLLKHACEQSAHVMMIVNIETKMIDYINGAHEKMTGLPRSSIEYNSVMNLDIFRNNPKALDYIISKLDSNETVEGDELLTRTDGSQYWLYYHVTGFKSEQGNRFALVTSFDNSQAHVHRADLERLAWHCSLTGLHNRAFFTPQLNKATDGVLVLIDLIGFKRFNDTHGHQFGDDLLVEVGRRLKHIGKLLKAIDVARVGSDEFCLLLPEHEKSTDVDFVNRLITQLSAPVVIHREKIEPKSAIAIVNIKEVFGVFPPLSCADIALQYAKKKALRHVQLFNQDLLNQYKNNHDIERDLQFAVKGRQFELYYQPLMDLKTKHCIGAEALIRWNHPKKGILYPGAFIDVAEQSGMINAIGEWVLENACKQLYIWQHKNVDITMHVNVAARQFFSGKLFDQVWDLLNRYRLKPGSIVLEITETELMGDVHYATLLCQELAELGVGIAIDDFGTGYSSMKYLKQFPINKLKIDRSFITDISSSKQSREIVSAIIAMAKALNISITAEGVETSEQEGFLSESLVEHAQGYLYSPAIRVNDFNQLMNNDFINEVSGLP